MQVLACLLIFMLLWFGSGVQDRKINPLADCFEMCVVKYVEANILFGVDPDYGLCYICIDNCRRKFKE